MRTSPAGRRTASASSVWRTCPSRATSSPTSPCATTCGRRSGSRFRRQRAPGRAGPCVRDVPDPRRAPPSAGRHAVGRRAADAHPRSGVGGAAEAADRRRDVARPRAAAGRPRVRVTRAGARRGRHRAAHRAVRGARAGLRRRRGDPPPRARGLARARPARPATSCSPSTSGARPPLPSDRAIREASDERAAVGNGDLLVHRSRGVRRASGKSTQRRCRVHWLVTTSWFAPPSSLMAATWSRPRVTGSMLRSAPPTMPSSQRSRPSGRWQSSRGPTPGHCACAWVSTPVRLQHRDGDYYGTALNRAARLMAIAHAGQLLVSDATSVCSTPDRTQRSICWIWVSIDCATSHKRHGSTRSARRDSSASSRRCGRWMPSPGIFRSS